jgi:uncharacterized membrane protein YdjX (TVP38/TMEM64 family)
MKGTHVSLPSSKSAGTPPPKTGRWLLVLATACGLVLVVGLILAFFWSYVGPWIDDWSRFLTSKEKVRTWILSYGAWAPLVFVAIQALQVVVAPIPGEATGFLGGYLFGIPYGFLLSTLGLTIGSTLAFLLGRWLEIHFVEKIVAKETLEKFDFIVERQGTLIAFLLFLIPGFPKDYLSFILGLSKMPLRVFLVITTVGRMPGTFLLTLQGANVYKGRFITFFVLLGLFLVAALILFLYKETIYQWLRRWGKQNSLAYTRQKAAAQKKAKSAMVSGVSGSYLPKANNNP